MTNVNYAAPPARPVAGEAIEAPTIKTAGPLNDTSASALIVVVAMVAVVAILAGSMVLAIMTSHGRAVRGLAIYATAGVGGLVLTVLATAWVNPDNLISEAAAATAVLGLGWLVLGAIAFAVGWIVRPKRPDVSAF